MAEEKKSKLEKMLESERITEEEAILAIKSSRKQPSERKSLPIAQTRFRYGYFSDPHIGSKYFSEPLFEKMVKIFRKEKVEFIVNPGDHLEGMSGRPGHIYELDDIGYEQQLARAVDLYKELPAPMFGIDGNHDQWFFKKNNGGAIVGRGLEARLGENYTHLGQDEGWIDVAPGVTIMLFHGNDGTAYADSYKLQKLIESFDENEKPSILHSGHYHKAMYMFRRGVHGFESGTLSEQSRFMRGKKIAAHMGFGVVDVWHNSNGVDRLEHLFVPYNPPRRK